MGEFAEGVYESLETAGLMRQLRSLPLDPSFEVIDPAKAREVLARHIADVVRRTLHARDEPARVVLVNDFIGLLHDEDATVTGGLLLARAGFPVSQWKRSGEIACRGTSWWARAPSRPTRVDSATGQRHLNHAIGTDSSRNRQ